MSWFSRSKAPKPTNDQSDRSQIPDDIWTKCPSCSSMLYTKELRAAHGVCSKCNYHFRLKARERLPLLVDPGSFDEFAKELKTDDPLNFKDSKRYKDRIKAAEKKSGETESVISGRAKIHGIPVSLALMEFHFIGGSLGAVAGEKLTRAVELGIEEHRPVIIVSASGGARMQEGVLSLMQMAKVSAALGRLGEKRIPYISVLTDPTFGGVAASFAMLGDVILAEPNALVGFAGARVIEQTIRQKLPEGFQRAEFLLEHGMLDRIVQRDLMRDELATILSNFGFGN